MSRKNIAEIYPLSPSQQGMLFETLAFPHSGRYIEQTVLKITGDLDVTAFKEAWQQTVIRYSVLRTSFVWQNQEEPLQVVFHKVSLPFIHEDWRAYSTAQQQQRLKDYVNTRRKEGFALNKPPLFRLGLFTLTDESFRFVLTFHHILMDGWSLPLVIRDVLIHYQALQHRQSLQFAPSPPYVNYIRWLKRQDLSKAEAFWRERLHGITEPTLPGKPVSQQKASSSSPEYGEYATNLPAGITTKLQHLAKQHSLTMNTLVQGIWGILLSRYSGCADIVFGATVSGRPSDITGIEAIAGLFINTLPVRMTIAPDTPFLTWLRTFSQQQVEQLAYEYCSAGQIHQWSELPSGKSLYESLVVFENYPLSPETIIPDNIPLTIEDTRALGAQTAYALTILITPGPELKLQLIHDQRRIDKTSVQHIARHLLLLFHIVVENPQIPIQTLIESIADDQIPVISTISPVPKNQEDRPFVPPRTNTEQRLAELWKQILGVATVGVHDNFFDLGGHSLIAMRLVAAIQEAFGKHISMTTLFETPTLATLAELIDREYEPALGPFSPLIPMQPEGKRLPFFCIHAVDGGVYYYTELARHLGKEQPFYGLQAYGLESGTDVLHSVEEMASRYIEAIRSRFPKGPYCIGGYSSGGIHAYEIAQQLWQAGEQVALLALIDMPPSYDFFEDTTHFLSLMRLMGEYLETDLIQLYAHTRKIPITPDYAEVTADMAQFSSRQRLEILGQCIQETGALPSNVSTERMERIITVFTTNSAAVQHYEIKPCIGDYEGQVVLFRSRDDLCHRIPLSDYGWSQYLSLPINAYDVPGTHFTIIRKPNVGILARHLSRHLEQLSGEI